MESSGAYHQRLRTAAAAYGRTLRIIYFSRLDLVDHHTAATPGFEADYLVDAGESWRNVAGQKRKGFPYGECPIFSASGTS